MTTPSGVPATPPLFAADDPKAPWGQDGKDGDGAGPRNPWSTPPSGPKGPAKPSALDEFLKRARGVGGGGGGSSGGGLPGLSHRPEPRTLWAIGVGIIVAIWLLYTSVHPVGPQQQGVVSYFGRYQETLSPGISLTLPAPIARVRVVDVQKIRTESFPQGDGENLMLTGDRSIVDLAYSVRWDITNPVDYVFRLADPQQTVRDASESAMRAVLATTTFQSAIGAGRTVVEARVAQLTQTILDRYKAGVRIQGVSIRQASAPARIIEDFNAVTAAQQEAVTATNNAQSYSNQLIAGAQGDAAQFDKVYGQYRLAPDVTRRRLYYETMEAVLARSNKTIVEVPGISPLLPLGGHPLANPAATPGAQP